MTCSTKLAEKPGFLRLGRLAYSGDRITLLAKSEEVMPLSQFSTPGGGLGFNTAFSKPEWPVYNGSAHEPNTLRRHLIPSEKAQDLWLLTASHPFNERVLGQETPGQCAPSCQAEEAALKITRKAVPGQGGRAVLGEEKGWGEIKLTSFIPSRQGICASIALLSFLTHVGLRSKQILWLDFGGGFWI